MGPVLTSVMRFLQTLTFSNQVYFSNLIYNAKRKLRKMKTFFEMTVVKS